MIKFGNSKTEALKSIIQGVANHSSLVNQRLNEIVAALDNQTRMLNEKLEESILGVSNQSSLVNQRLNEVIAGLDNQTRLLNDKLNTLIKILQVQNGLQGPPTETIGQTSNAVCQAQRSPDVTASNEDKSTFREAMQRIPLLLAEKTFNTSHPDYDATAVRNYPGRIFNADAACSNVAFQKLKDLSAGSEVPDQIWDSILKETLEEVKTVPHADQIFERRAFIERYTADIQKRYGAHYSAGWVNFDDALFLYWLVRHLKPRTIVQAGVCNGLSSAFMMLALAKNGSDGRLHAVDLPPVFNSNDPAWTISGNVYGTVIPEGKFSGWIVPDAYRHRFEVQSGDAKTLLPKLVDAVTSIDLFYHDSDHTYNHMMFEFREVKRKLARGGLIVADDISWNSSVWDFADGLGVPSYNYKGAVGVAFF